MCEHGDFEREKEEQDYEQLSDAKENEKFLKPVLKKTLIVQNMRFSRLNQVTNKSPNTLETKNFKNFSKCFSQLEGPPASKS